MIFIIINSKGNKLAQSNYFLKKKKNILEKYLKNLLKFVVLFKLNIIFYI